MKRRAVAAWRNWLPALLLMAAGAPVFLAWLAPSHLAVWPQLLSLCS